MVDGSVINHEQIAVVKESNRHVANGVMSLATRQKPWKIPGPDEAW